MPTAPGEWIDHWKRRTPAFLARVETHDSFGSGLQVDERHVLTCAHVLCADGPETYYNGDPASARNVMGRSATVHFGQSQVGATVKVQHATLDLALLELASPRHGVVAPLTLRDDYAGGEAQILGIARNERGFTSLVQTIADLRMVGSFVDGELTHIKHHFGPMEGASGGGVFAAHDGALIFLGLAYLGGERASIGGIIGAPAVVSFLNQHCRLGEVRRTRCTPHELHLQSLGLAPSYEFKTADGPLSLPFVPLAPRTETGAPRASFLMRRAVSAREARLGSSGPIMPGHDRLPARVARIEDAEAAVSRLSTAIAWPLRLPAMQELEAAWDLANVAQLSRVPEGRPVALRDFDSNPCGFDVPPVGLAEWIRGKNGAAQAVEIRIGHGRTHLTILSAAEAGSRLPVFRAAFDVSGM